jgi:2-keto-3-deoxy-L-rhamnonate aldolase RhmA
VIEEASAVEQIDAIAATEGVDVLFIGTSDLSFSLGLRGRQDEPVLQAAIQRIADAARRHGKFLGRPGRDAARIRRYMEEGFLMFQMPTEVGLMEIGARQLLDPFDLHGLPPGSRALY